MKAYDIYKRTLAIMFEREGEDKAFYNNFCNILSAVIAESLPCENSIRCANGKEKLIQAPVISDMDEEVDMSVELCEIALPYGVASYFAENDGDGYNSGVYRERFVNALNEAKRCIFTEIQDVYGGECV